MAPLLLHARVNLRPQHANIGQVSVPFGVVESIAHHKPIGDAKPNVVTGHIYRSLSLFPEQTADPNARRASHFEMAPNVLKGQAAVDDVLDDHQMLTADRPVEVLKQANDAAAGRVGAVA